MAAHPVYPVEGGTAACPVYPVEVRATTAFGLEDQQRQWEKKQDQWVSFEKETLKYDNGPTSDNILLNLYPQLSVIRPLNNCLQCLS